MGWDETLFSFRPGVPFNTRDLLECQLRILPPHASQIKRPHIAYVGDGDTPVLHGVPRAESEARKTNAPLTVVKVRGDHGSSLDPAVSLFLSEVQKTLAPPPQSGH